MPRMQPLPPETTPELKAHFDFFLGTLGFTPNSVLTMQRKPKLLTAFAQLNGAVMDPAGEVDLAWLQAPDRSCGEQGLGLLVLPGQHAVWCA